MTEITLEEQRARLQAYEKGFFAIHLMKIGIELGLFTGLQSLEDGATVGNLANELRLHEPYVAGWCKTAYHMEILDCDGEGRFRLAPHMDALLADSESPYHFGPAIHMRVHHSAEHLKSFPQYFRSGGNIPLVTDSEEFSKAQKAMSDQGIPAAYIFMVIPSVPGLQDRLNAGLRVLDVGCGSGLLMLELAGAFPTCHFVGVDVDRHSIEDAQRRIRDNATEDRVAALLLDAGGVNWDGEFDLANICLVLHEMDEDVKRASIANCHRALKDYGEIVIFDFAYPQGLTDLRKPEYTAGIMDQFVELTRGSEILPFAAKEKLLLEQGFRDPTTVSVLGGSYEVTHALK
ncbi:MAG: class I SAM-dependent methyltransferase [Dehalococcoidia bacterium]|nr:class I SAM-dependent methyltransferase [Dehalococcoidia bacterium]